REGDTVIVSKIDRLGRSLVDLNKIVSDLVGKGAQVVFIDDNITFSGNDDAMNKLIFNMLSSFAEFEREIIVQRTTEGRERALKRGQRLGRRIAKAHGGLLNKRLRMKMNLRIKVNTV